VFIIGKIFTPNNTFAIFESVNSQSQDARISKLIWYRIKNLSGFWRTQFQLSLCQIIYDATRERLWL